MTKMKNNIEDQEFDPELCDIESEEDQEITEYPHDSQLSPEDE
jgi:hypothetical protein